MKWQQVLPTQLGSMGHCVVPGNVSPLVVTRGKAPKAPTILKGYLCYKKLFFVIKQRWMCN